MTSSVFAGLMFETVRDDADSTHSPLMKFRYVSIEVLADIQNAMLDLDEQEYTTISFGVRRAELVCLGWIWTLYTSRYVSCCSDRIELYNRVLPEHTV